MTGVAQATPEVVQRFGSGRSTVPAHRHVARLVLTDFRSYGRAVLELDGGPVVLTGRNGAGKTNLLEAVSLLAPGRGLRGARLSDMTRAGAAGGFGVAATLAGDSLDHAVATGMLPGSERRVVKLDGTVVPQTALAERIALLWLTPQMDRLWIEGAAGRRRFLDRLALVLNPAHGAAAAAYERARDERLRLLRSDQPDRRWLDLLEERLVTEGLAMAAARRATVAALNAATGRRPTAFPAPRLAVTGLVEDLVGQGLDAAAQAVRLRGDLGRSRARDAEAGQQSTGIHRADLAAVMDATGMAAGQGSTGEQKAMLLSITLGLARLVADRDGTAPVLLLDEVAAHLDDGRRALLYAELVDLGGQAFMTGTDMGLFAGLETAARFFEVGDGVLRPGHRTTGVT